MKILAQVNRIRNASEDKVRQAKNTDPNSDFLFCTFPIYEDLKLKGVDKHICVITVLWETPTCVFLTMVFLMPTKTNLFGLVKKEKKSRIPSAASHLLL